MTNPVVIAATGKLTGVSGCTGFRAVLVLSAALAAFSCAQPAPTSPASAAGHAAPAQSGPPWGPETPHFNLEVILRGDGFGHVKFRQPNDDALIIRLDTWVRGLAPNTSYLLQRAVDATVDDNCTSTSWLTLGKGALPQSITTDDKGRGREELFRSVAAFPVGSEFDIHFRVIHQGTSAVVLSSDCYQFTISQ